MKERYKMMKALYPKNLIFLEGRLLEIDLDIYQYIYKNIKHINVLFLENLEIKKKIQREGNLYDEYYIKVNMLKIIQRYIELIEKNEM